MDAATSIIHEKVLITVKTYPSLSSSYGELVCTAGLRENGSWIRLYPIPFRLQDKDSQYKKYQWIELDVRKRSPKDDYRKESFSPANLGEIKLGEFLKPEDPRRSEIVHKSDIYEVMSDLTDGPKRERISLATFKPSRVKGMIYERGEREWNQDRLDKALQSLRQGSLFDSESVRAFKKVFTPARKIPYRFKYVFEDTTGREITSTIEDWELGRLFLRIRDQHDEKTAIEQTIEKYESFISNPDLLFFLGTTKEFHHMSDNPFMIIGVYHQSPNMKRPKTQTPTLFDYLETNS